MRVIELTIDPEWLATLDVLAKREDPPECWPPGKPYSEQERAGFARQQPDLHEIIFETLRETRSEEEIAALYDSAARLSLEDLRGRFRELTIEREPSQRERNNEEARRVARAMAFYDTLWSCDYELGGEYPGTRRHEDAFESVRETIHHLTDTLCP